MVISDEGRRARWVEAETIHLKRIGLSFDKIADLITRVGRGQAQALVAMPELIVFPPNYQITRQACFKAFRKAIAREPALELEELRKIDYARSEEMFLNLQPAIRNGIPRAIDTGIKLLDHSARINGYAAQSRESNGIGGDIVTTGRKLSRQEVDAKVNLYCDAVKILQDLGVSAPIQPDLVPLLENPSECRDQSLTTADTNLSSDSDKEPAELSRDAGKARNEAE